MVAAPPVYPYPHPSFPEALLPDSIKSKLQKDSKPYYPQSVLDKQKPLDSPAYDQLEKLAKGAVSMILALSLIAAGADILWVGNSPMLNYSAGQKKRKQTVWLRRILLLETLAACHGLASGLLHHWETILYAPTSAAPHSMVYALMGEYDSHRTHFATFQVIAKPGPITRLLLLGTQVGTLCSLS
ncbi:TPA: inducible alternative oxidase 2, variant 2 [Trebouxia sp. C0004]